MMVPYARARDIIYIYATANATHAKHVLTLQVGAVAPPQHLHHQIVVALPKKRRDVKLGHIAGSLGVAHLMAVKEDEGGTVDGVEAKNGAPRQPLRGHIETKLIGAHGINTIVATTIVVTRAGLDERRRIVVRILYVAIDGVIITQHFPARGHGYVIPGRGIHGSDGLSIRTLLRRADKVELPHSVKTLHQAAPARQPRLGITARVSHHGGLSGIRHIVSHGRQPVDSKDRLVLPEGRLDARLLNLLNAEPAHAVGLVNVGNLHLAVEQGEHSALVGAGYAIDTLLPLYRLQAHQRIAPMVGPCRPLQQIVDMSIVAAIIKALAIEGPTHNMATGGKSPYGPVLAAVKRVNRLSHYMHTVAPLVAVTQHPVGESHRAETVGAAVGRAKG